MAQYTNQAQLSYKNTVLNSNVAVGEILEVLSASKTAVRDRYSRNDDVTYVISIVNSGTTAFTGLTVSDNLGAYGLNGRDPLPSRVRGRLRARLYKRCSADSPTDCDVASAAGVGCSLPANSNMTIIYEAVTTRFAPLSAAGTITNTATISGDGAGSPVTATATVTAKAERLYDKQEHRACGSHRERHCDIHLHDTELRQHSDSRSRQCIRDRHLRPCAFQPLRRFQRHSMDRRHRIHLQRRYRRFSRRYRARITIPAATYAPGCRNRDMEHHTWNRNTHSKRHTLIQPPVIRRRTGMTPAKDRLPCRTDPRAA